MCCSETLLQQLMMVLTHAHLSWVYLDIVHGFETCDRASKNYFLSIYLFHLSAVFSLIVKWLVLYSSIIRFLVILPGAIRKPLLGKGDPRKIRIHAILRNTTFLFLSSLSKSFPFKKFIIIFQNEIICVLTTLIMWKGKI